MRAISLCTTSRRSRVRASGGLLARSWTRPLTEASGFLSSWATLAPTDCSRPICSVATAARSSDSASTAAEAADDASLIRRRNAPTMNAVHTKATTATVAY